jgi:chromosome segregation ATPase
MSDPAPRPTTTTTTTTTFVKLQQTVDELERELETAESRLKTRRSDIVTLEENLDAERALAKRLRGEFADVLAEIATTKAALMKSNFEIEDVLREIEPHRRHSIGEPSPGAPETIEETDAEAPDPERLAASRRAARLAACEEGFEREKARTADFLKSLRAYENRLQAERRRDALQRAR